MAGTAQAKGLLQAEGGAPAPEETGFVGAVRWTDRAIAKAEELSLTFVLLALLFLGVYQLVTVHWFPPAPYWSRDVIHYCVLYIAVVAGALAAQSDRLFNIDMFARFFNQRGKLLIRILTAAFTLVICWVAYKAGMRLRDILAGEADEVAAEAPAWWLVKLKDSAPYFIPFGMLLIASHFALHILIDGYYLVTGKPSPDVADVVPKV